MNKKQIVALGVKPEAADVAVECLRAAGHAGYFKGQKPRPVIKDIMSNPDVYASHVYFGPFAKSLLTKEEEYIPRMIPFTRWGDEIDDNTIAQINEACKLPDAVGAALMPDAHLGYGLPIGGVLATKNVVIPYAVGVDIACRMKLSVLDLPLKALWKKEERLERALSDGTYFGVGRTVKPKYEHPVMDKDWNVTSVTKLLKDKAWSQMGTSGSGNHFVEFGTLKIKEKTDFGDGVVEPGEYVALLSHSGSRGAGAAVCKHYSDIAKGKIASSSKYKKIPSFINLAWLSLDDEAGVEYWVAMNLMGDYASANHFCIHKAVVELLGCSVIAGVENHHNFAWKEEHNGEEVIVHRKGATPAGQGILGVIPGSMADPAYVVRGKGSAPSWNSASHGAGRRMSRTKAKETMNWPHWKSVLKERGVKLLSAGIDEVPGVYKDIRDVMAAQADLVDIVAEFMPKIVKMSDDGQAED